MTTISAPFAIGVDVGATKIAAALVTRQGEVLVEARADTAPAEGPAAVVERIAALVIQLAGRAPGPLAGVGIGTPGLVDSAHGIVRNAVNLGWTEVELAEQVRRSLDGRLPSGPASGQPVGVWVENDANIQALGEVVYGAARGLDNCICITIGTGLGSGIVLNGRIVTGATFSAAELGHLSFDPGGRRCACGLRGCLETVVSGPGLAATVRELLAAGQLATSLHDGPELAARTVEAARRGDPLAQAALAETARWLGMAFASVAVLLNPAMIVVGGGFGLSAFDLLIPGARAELARRAVAQSHTQLQIVPSQVMSSAVGASSLVWQEQHLWTTPAT